MSKSHLLLPIQIQCLKKAMNKQIENYFSKFKAKIKNQILILSLIKMVILKKVTVKIMKKI
jgi:hypothetical protein